MVRGAIPSERHLVLARLAADLPAAEREAGASEALGLALSLLADDALPADACRSVCALAPYAPADAVSALVEACAAAVGCQRPVVTAVAARLCDLGRTDDALALVLVATLPDASDRIEVQSALLTHFPAAVREAAWAELSSDLRASDGARTLLERNAAAWTGVLGAVRGPEFSGRMRSSTCHASSAPRGQPWSRSLGPRQTTRRRSRALCSRAPSIRRAARTRFSSRWSRWPPR
ncbi:hypothetical protein WME94_19920 [Sorangium sp. So ce429]